MNCALKIFIFSVFLIKLDGYKLIRTLVQGDAVCFLCEVKLYYATYSLNYLASGSYNGTIKIWDLNNGSLRNVFNQTNNGHSGEITSMILLENGYLASGSGDYKIKVWDIINKKLKFTFDQSNAGHSDWITSLVSLKNGQ
jgi:WD40 repeat protein